MRAIVVTEPGGPEVMAVVERPDPEPGPGRIRVRIRAAGVNRADLLQRRGGYPAPPGWPADVPGLEFAGEVDAVGEGVERWSAGDRVMGIVGGGGYAEALATDADAVVPVPGGLSWEEAAAIPEAFMTAFDAVDLQAGLASGELLLVHAAGSGVGTAALQLARAAGARVAGTSRTPEKLERATELGLDLAVRGGDGWPARLLEATDGRRPDVILDLVGGPYLPGNQEVLAERGRWIVVGVTGGARAEIDLRALMVRRASVTGTVLRARPLDEKVGLARAFERRVLPLFASGALAPVVDRALPAEDAAEAHRLLEADATFGKVVLVW